MPIATEQGGAEATLLHLLRHADSSARWLIVFLEDGPMVDAVRELDADAAVVPAGRVRQVFRNAAVLRRLRTVLGSWRPDVIVSWMSKAHLYASPVATSLRVPSMWFQHGLPSPNDPIDRLAALLPSRGILVPSRTVAAAQQALRPRRQVHVVYPGVERPDAVDGGSRHLLEGAGVPAGVPVVGMVARLQRWKGVHVMIEALPSILRSHPEAHMVIVGGEHSLEPDYGASLEQLVARLGVADHVHLVGRQPDGRRWMREFDVVVHASDNEPFGIVVVEAMALGKPLVAGRAGGPSEIVRHGVDGFLVEFGDADGIAQAVTSYLADPTLAERMGRAAAERSETFTAARFSDRVVGVLREAQGR